MAIPILNIKNFKKFFIDAQCLMQIHFITKLVFKCLSSELIWGQSYVLFQNLIGNAEVKFNKKFRSWQIIFWCVMYRNKFKCTLKKIRNILKRRSRFGYIFNVHDLTKLRNLVRRVTTYLQLVWKYFFNISLFFFHGIQ